MRFGLIRLDSVLVSWLSSERLRLWKGVIEMVKDVICVNIGVLIGVLGIRYGFIQYVFPVYFVIIIGLVISIEIDRRKEKNER